MAHASKHISGGADQIDGDQLDVDYVPTNYTRTTASPYSSSTEHLTSHLKGIDDAIGTLASAGFSEITPSVSTSQNDWSPSSWTGATHVLVNCTGASTITGLSATATQKVKTIVNSSSSTNSLTFSHESASSTAANRMQTATGTSVIVAPGQSIRFYYSSSASRWIQF